jgi:Spore germination protein.
MNGNASKITFVQVFMMLALMNGLASHVIVNPMILEASGRDSWIAVLAAGAIFLVWIMMLHWLMKRTGQRNWKEWLRKQASPALA